MTLTHWLPLIDSYPRLQLTLLQSHGTSILFSLYNALRRQSSNSRYSRRAVALMAQTNSLAR